MRLTDDAPANLLTFLEKNRDLLQVPGQDEQERTDTLADITMSHDDKVSDARARSKTNGNRRKKVGVN